ncbi:MAG: HNH endonuclease [Planctomycetaceae bacterium]
MSKAEWLSRMSRLKKGRGNAPHKPLLLLVFLDMIENGEYETGQLFLTPEMGYRFDTYFEVAKHRRTARPDIRLPFHHLGSQGFWVPVTRTGEDSKHRAITFAVIPNPDFVEACRDPEFRRDARELLIATHFEPAEQNALSHLIGIEIAPSNVAVRDACFTTPNDAENSGRSARFRLDVVSGYRYTCALTGYRVTTISAGAIVDAAHIHQFAHSRNNHPTNGIALCKNAHWLFDAGLWTIDDDYQIVVAADQFSESSPNQTALSSMNGRKLLLPANDMNWPNKENLAWHRKNKFGRFA